MHDETQTGTSRYRAQIRGCKGAPKKVLALLMELGWTVVRSRRHLILAHKNYDKHIILPKTTSDRRAARQAVTMVKRHLDLDLKPML